MGKYSSFFLIMENIIKKEQKTRREQKGPTPDPNSKY